MSVSSWSSAQVLQVASLVLALWFVEGVLVDASGLFNLCVNDAPLAKSLLSDLLFTGALLALLLLALLFVAVARSDARRWFALAFLFLWWYGTFLAIQIATAAIGDTACHRRHQPNAVSGHFGFFVFWNLSALWLLRAALDASVDVNYVAAPDLLRRALRSQRVVHQALAVAAAVLLLCSALTLFRTWYLGYHTLRQCVLGAAVAVVNHYLVANVLDHLFYARTGAAFSWARTWSLRTVGVYLAVGIVLDWLVSARSSLDVGVVLALASAGAVCVFTLPAPSSSTVRTAATKKAN
jgi:hypothetical protein